MGIARWITAVSARLGGDEKKELSVPDLVCRLLSLIEQETAGSPVNPDTRWTHLKPWEIAGRYSQQHGERISNGTVKRILRAEGYRKRLPSKQFMTGKSPHREEQFKILTFLTGLFAIMGHNPALS